jgi:hypothetical protein
MPQEDADNNSPTSLVEPPVTQPLTVYRPSVWRFIAVSAIVAGFGAGGIWFLIWASVVFVDATSQITFIVGSAINLLIFLSIVAQACIYWGQRNIMKEQWEAMRSALIQNSKMITQNERAMKAAEASALTAERAFHSSERPHFGITKIKMHFAANDHPLIDIEFMNGGKTPAWNFYALPVLTFGWIGLETRDEWQLTTNPAALSNSFIPAGAQKTMRYQSIEFKVTQERFREVVVDKKIRLFVMGTAHWRDSLGDRQWWNFYTVYYPELSDFGNYEA